MIIIIISNHNDALFLFVLLFLANDILIASFFSGKNIKYHINHGLGAEAHRLSGATC